MFGQYYGVNITPEDCDTRAVKSINNKILRQETGLFESKWFDYRTLHPTQASYLYAHYYREAYKRDTKVYIDTKQANFRKGISSDDFMLSKECSAIWRGRMIADALGIPYDKYIRYTMRYCREIMFWKTAPRPCHLTMEDCIEGAKEFWENDLGVRVILPKITEKEMKEQSKLYIDIQRFVCKQLKKHQKPHFGLKRYMLDTKILTEKIALEFFNSEVIDRAKELYF